MTIIERRAELCPEAAAPQPCLNCGSTLAVVEIFPSGSVRIRRLCCRADPWWHSTAGRAAHGTVAAEACHG